MLLKVVRNFQTSSKLHLRCNSSAQSKYFNSNMNEEQSNRKNNRNDVEELEEDDASTSEDENEENTA